MELIDIGVTSPNGAGVSATTLQVNFTLSTANEAISFQLNNVSSPCFTQLVHLAAGANTITLPASPNSPGGVMIVPQAEATHRATLKGISGDTGIVLHTLAPAIIPFHSTPPTNFVLTWAGLGYNATAVTAESTDDKITKTTHGLVDGDRVRFSATTLPGGLTANIWYYVVSATTDDFKVALESGGTPIDLTTDGTSVLLTTADRVKLVWF